MRGHPRRQPVALDVFQPAADDVEGVLFELLLDAMPLDEDGLGAPFGAGVDFFLHLLGRPMGLGDPCAQLAALLAILGEDPDPLRTGRCGDRRHAQGGRLVEERR